MGAQVIRHLSLVSMGQIVQVGLIMLWAEMVKD